MLQALTKYERYYELNREIFEHYYEDKRMQLQKVTCKHYKELSDEEKNAIKEYRKSQYWNVFEECKQKLRVYEKEQKYKKNNIKLCLKKKDKDYMKKQIKDYNKV